MQEGSQTTRKQVCAHNAENQVCRIAFRGGNPSLASALGDLSRLSASMSPLVELASPEPRSNFPSPSLSYLLLPLCIHGGLPFRPLLNASRVPGGPAPLLPDGGVRPRRRARLRRLRGAGLLSGTSVGRGVELFHPLPFILPCVLVGRISLDLPDLPDLALDDTLWCQPDAHGRTLPGVDVRVFATHFSLPVSGLALVLGASTLGHLEPSLDILPEGWTFVPGAAS